jgi:hypothetical protein
LSSVQEAFPVHPAYAFAVGSTVFDEQNLVSSARLVPVLELAGQTGLSRLTASTWPAVDTGEVRGGEPDRQADLDYQRNDVRRGQHR